MKHRSLWFSHALLFSVQQRKRVFSALVLVILTLTPLVIATLFTEGMIDAITDKYLLLQDGYIQANQLLGVADESESGRVFDNRITSLDHTAIAYGIAYSQHKTSEIKLKAVYESYFNEQRSQQLTMSGSFGALQPGLPTVMLSTTLANKLAVQIGDRLALMLAPKSQQRGFRALYVTVTGLFDSGYRQLDENLMFINFAQLERLGEGNFTVQSEFLIAPEVADNLDEIIESLRQGNSPEVTFVTWEQFNRTVYQNFTTSRQVIFLVFLLIGFIAAIYLASMAAEMVQDKRREIGLLKTLGMTNCALKGSFLVAVEAILLFGIAIGSALGIWISQSITPLLKKLSQADLALFRYYLLDFDLPIVHRKLLLLFGALLAIATATLLFTLRRIKVISPLEQLQQE